MTLLDTIPNEDLIISIMPIDGEWLMVITSMNYAVRITEIHPNKKAAAIAAVKEADARPGSYITANTRRIAATEPVTPLVLFTGMA